MITATSRDCDHLPIDALHNFDRLAQRALSERSAMYHEEAAALIAQFGSTGSLVRHIVREMVANPDTEDSLRLVAAACHELLTSTVQ